ncbi:DUF5719 family protein [Luteimicrobium subarcticum]|uniref:Uncharacterized protein n=1 Tax=Luteimicrobium subarcticum TaxID=620910 RepID=A0A2M8WTF9_9MICO|nr:DUF5719 family protein [Luteimicrobium subarcticum]PJI94241.1 hypothetical protein CLV34_1729 [Luteimicrobium subarcticum]
MTAAVPPPPPAGPAGAARAPGAPRRPHGRARALAGTLAGLLVVAGVAAGATRGADLVPAAESGTTDLASRSAHVDVPPGDTVLGCPAPARITDTRTGGDAQFTASPADTWSSLRVVAAAGGGAVVAGLGSSSAPLTTLSATSGTAPRVSTVIDPDGATGIRADPGGRVDPVVAASLASTTSRGDLRGLAATACSAPATDLWLVGGSTTVGSSTRLVVQNPGRHAATVTVEVLGANGAVTLADAASLVVPAGKEVTRLVESAAADQDRTVVHVSATGAAVTAYLQHTVLDGIVPQGVDFVAAGAEPARHAVVSGIVSRGEAVADARAPRLRLLATQRSTTADISVWGTSGRVWLHGLESVDLTRGEVVDVPLGGLPAGTYSVVVDAGSDVVAGGFEQRPGDAPATAATPWDTAWVPSQPWAADQDAPSASSSPVAVPARVAAAVVLTAVPEERASDAKGGGPVLAATVVVVTTDGQRVAKAFAVKAGWTRVVDPAEVTSAEPAAVLVEAPTVGATGAAWSVVLSTGSPTPGIAGPAPGKLFSVVAPVGAPAASSAVRVQQDPTVGLG